MAVLKGLLDSDACTKSACEYFQGNHTCWSSV